MLDVVAAVATLAAVAVGVVGSVGMEDARVAVVAAAVEAEADGAAEAGVTVAAITRIANNLPIQSTR